MITVQFASSGRVRSKNDFLASRLLRKLLGLLDKYFGARRNLRPLPRSRKTSVARRLQGFELIPERERRKTNVQRYRERHGDRLDPIRSSVRETVRHLTPETSSAIGNGDLPPGGKRGAAAALERLEASEERAHARLEAALARGNAIEIQAATAWNVSQE